MNGLLPSYPYGEWNIDVKVVEIEDHEDETITDEDLEDCFKFIREGERTLVICTAGVSRSATICIAYLMKHEHLSLKDAFDRVK